MVCIIAIGFAMDVLARDNTVITLIALLLLPLATHSRWRYVELAMAGVVAGLAAMVKLDQGIQCSLLLLSLLAVIVYRDWPLSKAKRIAAFTALCAPAVTAVAVYWISTGQISSLWGYFHYGLEIVGGYSDAMEMIAAAWETTLYLAVLVLVIAGIPFVAVSRRTLWAGYIPAVLAIFCELKHALVRDGDGHSTPFLIRVAVALLFLLVCARSSRDRRLILVCQLFAMVMGSVLALDRFEYFREETRGRLTLRPPYTTQIHDWVHWSATWKRFENEQDAARKSISLDSQFNMADRGRTVTAIPWDIDRIKAQNWNWKPIGALQFYSAYTPALDRLTAEQIESASGPERALIGFADIDGRHPFLSEPLSWRTTVDRYDVEIKGADSFLAGRRKQSRFAAAIPIRSETTTWGREIKVPRVDGVVLMSAQVNKNLFGKATTILLRGAPVFVGTKFEYGQTVWWRTVPANLTAGAIVEPLPQTFEDLYALFFLGRAPVAHYRVDSIQFLSHEPWRFQDAIQIQWSYLPISRSELAGPAYPLSGNELTPLWRPHDPLPQSSDADVTRGTSSIQVIPTGGDPQVRFKIPNLGKFRTLVIRARFQRAAHIDAFFGKQVDGRGLGGAIPAPNRWLDVYLNVAQNPFWNAEHGTELRFDPVPSNGPNTTTEIAGIWGSNIAPDRIRPEIECYFTRASEVPGSDAANWTEPAYIPAAADVEGFVDVAEPSQISGWVWDKSRPDTPTVIDIRDGETVLARIPAGQFRQDLLEAHKGNGLHAFHYGPKFAHDGSIHTIHIFASGTDVQLKGSPKTFTAK
jgi:hypothetical protein